MSLTAFSLLNALSSTPFPSARQNDGNVSMDFFFFYLWISFSCGCT